MISGFFVAAKTYSILRQAILLRMFVAAVVLDLSPHGLGVIPVVLSHMLQGKVPDIGPF